MRERLLPILEPYKGQRGATVPVLEKVQEELGYLPEEAISEVANFLGLTKNEVYGVASFYALFRFERPGEHNIRVCQGTACYVQRGRQILEAVQQQLALKPGKTTTEDFKFSLEKVSCFGSCALAPVIVIDKNVYGRMTPAKVRQVLTQY